jgi:hypothetical protein
MIRFQLTFTSQRKVSETFRYGMGIGHIKWKDVKEVRLRMLGPLCEGWMAMLADAQKGGHKNWKDHVGFAALCEKAAVITKLSPKPWEVLGCVARDGFGPYYDSESF